MHISGKFKTSQKVDIQSGKLDIESQKLDIEKKLKAFNNCISNKTMKHCMILFSKLNDKIFGRTMVEEVIGLKSSQSSNLMKLLLNAKIIEPVKGYGKGKYRFIK